MNKFKNGGVGPVIGYIGMTVMVAGVAVFLGGHSLNFFQLSFSQAQQAYAPLGLLLTEGGLFIWLGIFLWVAESNLQKGIALTMLAVSLVGGMATAVFDIYFETATGAAGFTLTIEEIKAMSLVVGALAVAHGVAMIFELTGNKIFEAFETATGKDINKDGHIGAPPKVNQNVSSNAAKPRPEASRATQQSQQSQYSLPAFLSASGMNSEQAFGAFLDETDGPSMGWKVLRDGQSKDGYKLPPNMARKNFNELSDKVHSNGRVKDF